MARIPPSAPAGPEGPAYTDKPLEPGPPDANPPRPAPRARPTEPARVNRAPRGRPHLGAFFLQPPSPAFSLSAGPSGPAGAASLLLFGHHDHDVDRRADLG